MLSIRNGRRAVAAARSLAMLGTLTAGLAACHDAIAPNARAGDVTVAPVLTRAAKAPITDEYIVVLNKNVSNVLVEARA